MQAVEEAEFIMAQVEPVAQAVVALADLHYLH